MFPWRDDAIDLRLRNPERKFCTFQRFESIDLMTVERWLLRNYFIITAAHFVQFSEMKTQSRENSSSSLSLSLRSRIVLFLCQSSFVGEEFNKERKKFWALMGRNTVELPLLNEKPLLVQQLAEKFKSHVFEDYFWGFKLREVFWSHR